METAILDALRWLPLTGWPRPACPPLPARVAEITTILRDASKPGADPLSGAAHALNKAALLASDCGLEPLARNLCWQHIDSYRQASRPLTVDLARRMLGPALNLARLKLRAGEPDSALQLLEATHTAVATGSDLIIDNQVLPTADLAGSPEEHDRLRNIVRQLYLTDGIRAHAMAGRWDHAASLAEELGGASGRLLEGRQAVIIARFLEGSPDAARRVLAEAAATDPWEGHVAACLTVMCSTAGETDATGYAMITRFLADRPAPGCILFWARLGLTIAALVSRAHPEGAQAVISAISEQAIQAADGYAARDIIEYLPTAGLLEEQHRGRLTRLVTASGLGCGALPPALLGPFNDAVIAALATQAVNDSLASREDRAREQDLPGRRVPSTTDFSPKPSDSSIKGSTVTGTTAVDADEARRLRDAMTDKIVKLGSTGSPAIEAAFRTVPRHAFALPGTPLEECYHGDVVRNKKDADGVTLSSISAAWLQARMIDQAGIGPGARVLEIGTTGYNAAVIAEVAGPGGHVVTVDIDPEVAGWATAALEATGYGDRVTVVTGDGEHGAPGHGPFDAIIVTAGAWDIPSSCLAQLNDNGTLVVPLRMNGVTRSVGFRKHDGHLASTAAHTCGFVPMQGTGARPETFFTVPAPGGGHITLRFEDGAPEGPPLPDDILASDPAEAWSGLTIPDMTPWSDLYLWLAGFQPGFCRLDQAGDRSWPEAARP